MGPEQMNGANLPKRPKYSWDAKNAPWTDGKGSQESYAESVELWKLYHDSLPENNSNKIPKGLQGLILKAQLYGRAKDLALNVSKEQLIAENGAKAIVDAIYKKDALTVISDVYSVFTELLNTKRGTNEPYDNFESRFNAKVSRFNSYSPNNILPESLVAFMLLNNAHIENSQRVSILAACANGTSEVKQEANATPSNQEFLNRIKYEQFASILRQCRVKQKTVAVNSMSSSLSGRRKITPAQLSKKKSSSQCRTCSKWGHWSEDHLPNGKLKPNVQSRDKKDDDTKKDGTVTFHMCALVNNHIDSTNPLSNDIGPLLDDGAPYSGIGENEFHLLKNILITNYSGKYDPLPDEIKTKPYWQYGIGEHSSHAKRIIGSVLIHLESDQGDAIKIRHLIIKGSSQWLVGRNVTKHCNIMRVNGNMLQLPIKSADGAQMSIKLADYDMHCHIPLSAFGITQQNERIYCAMASVTAKATKRSWSELRAIVDKVHKHVCGHAAFKDIRILLERNGVWNEDVKRYLNHTIDLCPQCKTTEEPKTSRKVSLRDIDSAFNDYACLDHLFLGDQIVIHFMDSSTRYSVGSAAVDKSVEKAIDYFEMLWVSQFGYPRVLIVDQAFANEKMHEYAKKVGMKLQLVPTRRHNKNVLESKHRVLRDIYLRIHNCSDQLHCSPQTLIQQIVRVSNNLYGNSVASAHELAKGYTVPLIPEQAIVPLSKDIIEANNELKAKRKLTRILRSKALTLPNVKVGDLVDVYVKLTNQKRGRWIGPKPILSFDYDSQSIKYPGKRGHVNNAALEDVRISIENESLAKMVYDANDELNRIVNDYLDECDNMCHDYEESEINGNDHKTNVSSDESDSDDSKDITQMHCNDEPDSVLMISQNDVQPCNQTPELNVGDRISVYWSADNAYYDGTVERYNSRTGKHSIMYDDGDRETLNMNMENFKLIDQDNENCETATNDLNSNAYNTEKIGESDSVKAKKLTASHVQVTPVSELTSDQLTVMKEYYDHFGGKEFTSSQAQGLSQFVLHNAYNKQESTFLQHVRRVHVLRVPVNSNVISSHTLYKVKTNDNCEMYMKARIVPHGNRDNMKLVLKTDSSSCPPVGVRIVCSIAAIMSWPISKIDFDSAFLQSGDSTRDVYVKPPLECETRSKFYWLLLSASYGLVNANAKWQLASDECLIDYGMCQMAEVPQLFYYKVNNKLKVVAAKVVDDVLFAGHVSDVRLIIEHICEKFKLGTIVYGPTEFEYYGLQIKQDEECTVTVDGSAKLEKLSGYTIDRLRRKQTDFELNALEKAHFASTNGKLCWIGVAASPFCAFTSSYLQQLAPKASVHDLKVQNTMLRKVQELGATTSYKKPNNKGTYKMSVLTFADASKTDDKGQLGMITGLLLGDLKDGSIFHALTWFSKKARRPVKSVASAEVLATSYAADDGMLLAQVYHTLTDITVPLITVVDSKDLYDTISTRRLPTDKSIKGDVSSLRYDFEVGNISRMIWISGKLNLADPLTKKDSPLEKVLQLIIYNGKLSGDYNSVLVNYSQKPVG